MSDIETTKAGSGCSVASCSLPDSACDDKPKKVLTRFLVAKEIVTSDGQRHFESCGSIWLDQDQKLVSSMDAWESVQNFERVENIPRRWDLEFDLRYIWTEGIPQSLWSDLSAERLPPLHQLPLSLELNELLISLRGSGSPQE